MAVESGCDCFEFGGGCEVEEQKDKNSADEKGHDEAFANRENNELADTQEVKI